VFLSGCCICVATAFQLFLGVFASVFYQDVAYVLQWLFKVFLDVFASV
jgi:hypothetical protein